MRKKKSAINMTVGVLVQLEIALIGILNRRFFINNLSIDYLGCNAVFVNVMEVLSLICGGFSAITFLMIEAVASDDKEQIRKVFKINHIYQWITCGLLAVIGSLLSPFLPRLLKNSTDFEWSFLQVVYLLFLADLCITNWSGITGNIGYYDCIIKATQDSAVCSIFDFFVKNIYMIGQCIVLVCTKDYILYLLIAVFSKIIYILLTRWYCFKHFPFLKDKISVTYEQLKETNLFAEIRNNLATVIAMVVFNGTDNIVITSFLGITVAGIYSNYQTIFNQLRGLISKFINGMYMSVADFVHRTSNDTIKADIFYKVQFLCGVVGLICTSCFFSLVQPFITIVFGDGLLLETDFVFIVSVLLFINIVSMGSAMFRHSMGKYWLDRNYQIISAAVNLVLSISLVKVIGLQGIIIGTIMGSFVSLGGYIRVVRREAIQSFSVNKYWIDLGIWLVIVTITLLVTHSCLNGISYSVVGMIYRLIGSIFISIVFVSIICVISRKRRECVFFYLNQIKSVISKAKLIIEKNKDV